MEDYVGLIMFSLLCCLILMPTCHGFDVLEQITFTTKMAKVFALLTVCVSAVELTPANWDEQTAGKTVFIKFLAPW